MEEIEININGYSPEQTAKDYLEKQEAIKQMLDKDLTITQMIEALSTLDLNQLSAIDFRSYLTAEQASKALKLQLKSFYNLTSKHQTPRYKVGRMNLYKIQDIEQLRFKTFAQIFGDL